MKKSPNQWLVFTSLAFQTGALIYIAVKTGSYLDFKYNLNNIFTLILTIAALVIIIILIITQANKFNDK